MVEDEWLQGDVGSRSTLEAVHRWGKKSHLIESNNPSYIILHLVLFALMFQRNSVGAHFYLVPLQW